MPKHRFMFRPRQTGAQRPQTAQGPLTPESYDTAAQTLVAAASALTDAAAAWRVAEAAGGQEVKVMLAKIKGQGAAIEAAHALRVLADAET